MTEAIEPQRTALLIMDIQPSIVAMVPDADAVFATLRRAQAAARGAGVEVVYVHVALTVQQAGAVPEGNKSFYAAAQSGRMKAGSPGVQVDPRLEPAPDEYVARKSRVGALSTTELDAHLRAQGVDTLVLCGIATSGVVLSTIRDAADRDYRLFVLEDACFDRDPEVHRVLMEKVFPRQATVINLAEFERSLA